MVQAGESVISRQDTQRQSSSNAAAVSLSTEGDSSRSSRQAKRQRSQQLAGAVPLSSVTDAQCLGTSDSTQLPADTAAAAPTSDRQAPPRPASRLKSKRGTAADASAGAPAAHSKAAAGSVDLPLATAVAPATRAAAADAAVPPAPDRASAFMLLLQQRMAAARRGARDTGAGSDTNVAVPRGLAPHVCSTTLAAQGGSPDSVSGTRSSPSRSGGERSATSPLLQALQQQRAVQLPVSPVPLPSSLKSDPRGGRSPSPPAAARGLPPKRPAGAARDPRSPYAAVSVPELAQPAALDAADFLPAPQQAASSALPARLSALSRFEAGGAGLAQEDGQAARWWRQQQLQRTILRGATPSPVKASPSPPPLAREAVPSLDPRLTLWEPPVSPFGLLEEELYQDPWRLMLACLLLNKTSATVVRPMIWRLLELYPTPEALIAADVAPLEVLLRPLGLSRKRAVTVQRFSHDYLHTQWRDPKALHGIGQYAADAYHLFCRGAWREVDPQDKDLRQYHQWLLRTDGLGSGLERGQGGATYGA